jgi:hypothetical protein
MAFVVIVMAALAIDITTLYAARSEAQLAADGAALAAARVLANSGMTSLSSVNDLNPAFPLSTTEGLATTAAVAVASSNPIGGKNLSSTGNCGDTQISVCYNTNDLSNPYVTVKVSRTDLPTFFLRFWSKQLAVGASATAEAYNPSNSNQAIPVAPLCVKPWVLPNYDPTRSPPQSFIFNNGNGKIQIPTLIGQGWFLKTGSPTGAPIPGEYYPATIGTANNDLPQPTKALPACSTGFTPYQLAVAGCVSTPISCSGQRIRLDKSTTEFYNTGTRDGDTMVAAECLIHSAGQPYDTDSIDYSAMTPPPFEFLAGNQNPVVALRGKKDILVSDSLVTIPVYDTPNLSAPIPPNSVQIIGFLQVFLNPYGGAMYSPSQVPGPYQIPVTIVNQVGCGTDASTTTPIYGNGPSPVPVRLITPPAS